MKSPLARRSSYAAWWAILAGIFLLGWLGYALLPILTPFAAAILLTYICHPAQKWLTRHRINPNLAVILVLLGLLLLGGGFLLVLLPLLFQQMQALYGGLGKLFALAQSSWLPQLQAWLGVNIAFDLEHLRTWLTANSDSLRAAVPEILKDLGSKGMAIVQIVANLVLTPVVFFYFLRDASEIVPRLLQLAPRRYAQGLSTLLADIDSVLGEFLRGQLTVMLAMSVIYSGGLWLIGLDAALPVGIVSGLLTFIPYVGSTTGLLLGALTAFTQYGDLMGLWPTLLVFLVGQTLESNFITPKLVGERIGLHPVAVIFALMAFGQLFGFIGILLALPLAAMLHVGLKHLVRHYHASPFYRTGAASPPRKPGDPV
ncbi:MAG: putative permease [Proteobacteria bacterium]|nr:putative permease [Pseudomonadota bacterium]